MKKNLLTLLMVGAMAFASPVRAEVHNVNALRTQHKTKIESLKKTPEGQHTFKIIKKYSKQYGVDYRLVNALIMTESSYNQKLVSPCGAVGLMQILPSTAKAHGYSNVYNKDQNIHAGVHHLSELLIRYRGNETLALAAYNAGCANVDRCNGSIPRYTKHYVKRVKLYKQYNYTTL